MVLSSKDYLTYCITKQFDTNYSKALTCAENIEDFIGENCIKFGSVSLKNGEKCKMLSFDPCRKDIGSGISFHHCVLKTPSNNFGSYDIALNGHFDGMNDSMITVLRTDSNCYVAIVIPSGEQRGIYYVGLDFGTPLKKYSLKYYDGEVLDTLKAVVSDKRSNSKSLEECISYDDKLLRSFGLKSDFREEGLLPFGYSYKDIIRRTFKGLSLSTFEKGVADYLEENYYQYEKQYNYGELL